MGVQENGVGATVKHYVANEYETERFTASSEVSAIPRSPNPTTLAREACCMVTTS